MPTIMLSHLNILSSKPPVVSGCSQQKYKYQSQVKKKDKGSKTQTKSGAFFRGSKLTCILSESRLLFVYRPTETKQSSHS